MVRKRALDARTVCRGSSEEGREGIRGRLWNFRSKSHNRPVYFSASRTSAVYLSVRLPVPSSILRRVALSASTFVSHVSMGLGERTWTPRRFHGNSITTTRSQRRCESTFTVTTGLMVSSYWRRLNKGESEEISSRKQVTVSQRQYCTEVAIRNSPLTSEFPISQIISSFLWKNNEVYQNI